MQITTGCKQHLIGNPNPTSRLSPERRIHLMTGHNNMSLTLLTVD